MFTKIAMDIDNAHERPDYLLVEKKQTGEMFTRKVYVGTVPDFASNVDGYKSAEYLKEVLPTSWIKGW